MSGNMGHNGAMSRITFHPEEDGGYPYSPVVRIGNVLHTAGQVGEDPVTEEPLEGIEAQTRQALDNLRGVLEVAGVGLGQVLRVGIYLTDFAHIDTVNAIYREYFSAPFPARTTVKVGLPEGLLIEIDALAVAQ